jgi:hypothetical protein
MTIRAYPQLDDRTWLQAAYADRGRSPRSIADEVGCHATAVLLALAGHQIPLRESRGLPRTFDPPAEDLRALYRQHRSVSRLAEYYGVSVTLTRLRLLEHGILQEWRAKQECIARERRATRERTAQHQRQDRATATEERKRRRDERDAELARLYRSGLTMAEAGRIVGLDITRVSKILKSMGVPARSRAPKNPKVPRDPHRQVLRRVEIAAAALAKAAAQAEAAGADRAAIAERVTAGGV